MFEKVFFSSHTKEDFIEQLNNLTSGDCVSDLTDESSSISNSLN
jgi:hypothetical protein